MDLVKTLRFLKSLSRNNNREWFEKNKGTYLECKESFEALVTAYLNELINFHPELASLNPKKLPFRIYRDVRFSKDKRPYKTNMGAGFSPNGKLVQEPGYYLHLEPGASFLAGGIYMPDPTNLSKIRQEIDYNGDKLERIMKDKSFRKWFKDFGDFDRLKTAPKGYVKDHPRLEWLKNRSFIVTHNFADAEVCSPRFVKNLATASQSMKPLIDYMKDALA